MLGESIRFTTKVLLRKPVRSLLTILQVSLGIAAVALVLNALMQPQEAAQGPAFIAADEQLIQVENAVEFQDPAGYSGFSFHPLFTYEDLEAVREIDGVISVPLRALTMRNTIEHSGMRYMISNLMQVNKDLMDIVDLPVVAGTTFADADFEQQSSTLVISEQAATALFGDTSPVGQKLTLTSSHARAMTDSPDGYAEEFEIIGVADISSGITMPYNLRPEHFMAPMGTGTSSDTANDSRSGSAVELMMTEMSQFTVVVKKHAVNSVQQTIAQMFNEKYGTRATLRFSEPYIPSGARVDRSFIMFLGGFALIGLIVSAIGILSIMMVSTVERTREIGLRRAIGASRLAVVVEILIEACMLATIGACLGLIAASVLAAPLSTLLSTNAEQPLESLARLSLSAVAASLGLSIAVGAVAGLFPAIQASLQSPVDALRDMTA